MKSDKEIYRWLRSNCGRRALCGLTSTDSAALVASVNLCNLISYESAPPELFAAYGAIVQAMQRHNRPLAYHAIACELDWSHRSMIWRKAGLLEGDKPTYLASFEDGGVRLDLNQIQHKV